MATPDEKQQPEFFRNNEGSSEDGTYVGEKCIGDDASHNGQHEEQKHMHLRVDHGAEDMDFHQPHSQTREREHRLDDDLAILQAEREVERDFLNQSVAADHETGVGRSMSLARSRSRKTDPIDDFDISTNPIHEQAAVYRPPENPSTKLAVFVKRLHESNWLIRYFTYIIPVAALLLVPLLLGALTYHNDPNVHVGGVYLMWFSIWLEIFWLTLWAGRILAKMIPWPFGLCASLFTNNSKKWRDMGKQLEIPATLFFWWLAVEISWLPTMTRHIVVGYTGSTSWIGTVNSIIVSVFVGVILNFVEKIIIQLIAISFHLRTYADRIEINKFQIGSLVKLYVYSKEKIGRDDSDFEDRPSGGASGARTPMQYVEQAQRNFLQGFRKVGDVAGKIAGDFTGKQVARSTHPNQIVLLLLNSTSGSQILARRLYRTFVREDCESVDADDMRNAFDNDEEAEAAFTMFDKDLNGDITMEELEAVCVEIGRERKSITASLKDLDSVVSKLDSILVFVVAAVTILVFITLISTSAAGVLASAGSSVLALSWLFSATAQEFLQSVIFVFVKHPFDVGDRVSVYGNTGSQLKGDDYFVKEISLLYTEFKKMEGHVVQAPNSYLNTLFILNMRRSGGLAEAVSINIKFGTSLQQIEELRARLLEFVRSEKREYQPNILTEVRDIVEAYSVNVNVVFFYKTNWQNELLRLQRRNKFICAMMELIQELGIEGPHPGQRPNLPLYVHYQQGNAPNQQLQPPAHDLGEPTVPSREQPISMAEPPSIRPHGHSTLRTHPSILRRRGESVSSMAKRVDFSLGMEGLSSSDPTGDVYDDVVKPPLPQIRAISEIRRRETESQERMRSGSVVSATGRDNSIVPSNSNLRRSSTESGRSRSHGIHRNRFLGGGDFSKERIDQGSMMEQGMAPIQETGHSNGVIEGSAQGTIDNRSGLISPQAVKDDGGLPNQARKNTAAHTPADNTNTPRRFRSGTQLDEEL